MYPKKRYSSYFCLVIPLFWTLCSTQSTQFCSNAKTGGLVTTTETEIDSPVNYVYWKPPDYNVLFVRTSKNTVYRSSDGGRVWASQLPFMASALDNPSGVQKIYPTADSSVFFFLGFNGKLWITKDNGTTYTKIQGNNLNFDELSPHPARAAWLLGTDYTPACYSSNTSITPPCYKRLWVSLDYGSSWNLIGTYIYSYSWTSAGLNGVPEKTIWMLDWPDKTGAQYAYRFRLIKKTSNLQLRHSVDFFQSVINHGLTNSIFFLYQNDNIYIARSLNKTLGLYVSEDYGRTFNKAQFPLAGGFSETQYSILDDTSEGKVFLAVTLGNPNWGNVYSSDSLGSTFDLSLKFVKKDSSGRAQFMKVKSVEGVYIANEVQNVHGLNNGAGPKTVISYDLGGEWNFLPLPLNNSDQPIPCNDQGCTLNLNSYPKRDDLQNFFYQPGPILSRKEAVGLVIATGNTGALLNTNTLDFSTIHTYLTRDAGWTWYDIGAGTNIYEFADHGALIVMANNVQPVKSFTYTWDEGLTFDNCTFTNNTNGVRIRNILVEPPLKAEEFLMHGSRINSGSTTVGVLIHIDFGNFHQRECIYPQDYELFSPYDNKDASQIHCELGVTTQYTRRKRDSACFNPDEYERAVQVSTCPCTLEDYECDICYERQGTVCSRVPECIPPDPVCENGVYYVTRGYRLIAGNQCNMSAPHAVNFLPVKAQCQSESNSSGDGNSGPSAGIIVLIVFLVMAVLFAIGAGLAYMRKKGLNPNVIRNKILNRQMEEESTAFDDDLLEAKEADELDDATLSQKFENKESAPENLI